MSVISNLFNRTPAYVGQEESDEQVRRERKYIAILFFAIAAFVIFDVLEDRADGAPWSHIIKEMVVVAITVGLGAYLWRRSAEPLHVANRRLGEELSLARADAHRWKEQVSSLAEGLYAAIIRELDGWNLTDAEKDVALLILKGLSHKEIAVLRKTAERTVRQQAAAVYQKSGLSGRAELSAYFLEDLLSAPAKQ